MLNPRTVQLIDKLVDAKQKDFKTRNEYLAWRVGFLTAVLATVADNDSFVKSAIIDHIKRSIK